MTTDRDLNRVVRSWMDEGVTAHEFETRHGAALHDRYGAQIDELTGLGLLDRNGARLRLTPRGALLANDDSLRFL